MGDDNKSAQDLFGAAGTSTPTPGSTPSPAAPPTTTPAAPAPGGTPTPSTTPAPGTATPGSPTPSVTPPPGMTAEMVQQIVSSAVKGVAGELKPKEPEKPFTQEDFERTFNVVKMKPEDLAALAEGGEKAIAIHNNLLQGAVRQAVTMAQHLQTSELGKLQAALKPYMDFATTVREDMYRKEFYDTNKDLSGFEHVVDDVKTRLEREGLRGTKDEVFKRLAEETRKVIKSITEKGGTPAAGGSTTQPTTTQMTPLSSGGQGGAGPSNAGGGHQSNTAKAIFG